MFAIERKITPGEVVILIGLILSAGGAYASTNGRLNTLEEVMKRFVTMQEVMIRLETKMDERAKAEEKMEKKMERLEEKLSNVNSR